MPAVRHPFRHDAQRSPVDDVELYGGHADSAEMFGTAERPVPEGKTRIVYTVPQWRVKCQTLNSSLTSLITESVRRCFRMT